MKIAVAGSRLSRKWKTEEWYWDQLVDRLREPARTGETMAEYQAMTRDEKTMKKDVGGFVGGAIMGGRRVAGAVTERSLITLDADFALPGDVGSFACVFDNVRCCVYSTHSHTPEHPKLRWILPLKRAVSAEEYVAVARKVADDMFGIERMDPLTYQPERLMFWPSCSDDAEYVFYAQDGAPIDPDAVLREYGPGDAWRQAWRWPVSSREGEVVQREQKTQADPLAKPGIVGAFCRTYTVQEAIDAFGLPYERADGVAGERYTYTRGSTAAGAVVYGDGRWLYSNHATDPAGGQLCNAWDLVRIHKFGGLDEGSQATDATRLPSYKAMCELAGSDPAVRGTVIDSQFGDLGTIAPVSDVTTEDNTVVRGAGDTDDVAEDDSWKDALTTDRKTGMIDPTLNNACVILEQSPAFRGKLAFCKMGDQIYVTGPMPWEDELPEAGSEERERELMGEDWAPSGSDGKEYHGPPHIDGRVWTEQDSIQMYRLFERWKYPAGQRRNGALDNALLLSASKNSFSPIEHYLKGLRWDGVERLDTMLIRWMGAEDCELNRAVTRLWMMGAVDRVMRPGCQFDSILVFKGEQGIGKTRMMRALVGSYYNSSLPATSASKENAEQLQGSWVIDLGELDSIKKSSITAFKNFITQTDDKYRKAYAVDVKRYPRQCVFFGTTNEDSFLRDATGERRFWVVPCAGQKGMNKPGLKGTLPGFNDEVEQIWAEAVAKWRQRMFECRRGAEPLERIDAKLYLTDPELEREMEERLSKYKLADPDRDEIETYLEKKLPDNWEQMTEEQRSDFEAGCLPVDGTKRNYTRREVTLKELRVNVFHEPEWAASSSGRSNLVYRINSIMDTMPGWKKVGRVWKSREGGSRYAATLWIRADDEDFDWL